MSVTELNAELAHLQILAASAVSRVQEWKQAHIADYAAYPLGTRLYNLKTGEFIGVVEDYHLVRPHEPSMRVGYDLVGHHGTRLLSDQYPDIGSAAELAAVYRAKAAALDNESVTAR